VASSNPEVCVYGQSEETFVASPDASEVKMTLKTTHEVVNGTFHIQPGSLEFDPSAAKMSGSVVVLAGSGKTGNGSRDKKMNKDILEVEQHATVSFEPKSYAGAIAPSGDSTIQVTGISQPMNSRPHERIAHQHWTRVQLQFSVPLRTNSQNMHGHLNSLRFSFHSFSK
jgi:hypothetical protein